MASKEAPSFDDMTPVESSNDNDDDVPTVKLDPGESFVAEVRHIERNVGKWNNTVLHLTRSSGEMFKYWSCGTIDRKLEKANVGPGDTIGVRKSEDQYEFTTEDGEGGEAYDFEVRVL